MRLGHSWGLRNKNPFWWFLWSWRWFYVYFSWRSWWSWSDTSCFRIWSLKAPWTTWKNCSPSSYFSRCFTCRACLCSSIWALEWCQTWRNCHSSSENSEFKMRSVSVAPISTVIQTLVRFSHVTGSWCSRCCKSGSGKQATWRKNTLKCSIDLYMKTWHHECWEVWEVMLCPSTTAFRFWFQQFVCFLRFFALSQKLLSVSFHDTRSGMKRMKWPWHIMRGIYMVVVNTLPGLCTLIPTLVAGPPDSFNILQHSIWASREIMNWLFAGVVVLYALRLSMRGWLIAVTLLPHCPRHNRVICSILMPVLMSVMLLGPAYGLHCLFFAFWTDNKKVNKKSVSHVFANWSFFQGQK